MNDLETIARQAARQLAPSVDEHLDVDRALADLRARAYPSRLQHSRRWLVPVLAMATAGMVAAGVWLIRDAHEGTVTVVGAPSNAITTATGSGVTAAPPTTIPTASSASSPAPPAAAIKLVYVHDQSLVWADTVTGPTAVSPLDPAPGYSAGVAGATRYVAVEQGQFVYIFDPAAPTAPPKKLGPYGNLGIVLTNDGFWASESVESNGHATWRQHDWNGEAFGPSLPVTDFVIPFGPAGDGFAGMVMSTLHIVVIGSHGTNDLGLGFPVAANGSQVAFVQAPQLMVLDTASGTKRSVADVGAEFPAQTTGAGAFSPDGSRLAVVTKSQRADGYHTEALVVVEIATTLLHRVPTDAGAAVDWAADGAAIVLSGDGPVRVVNPVTGAISGTAVGDVSATVAVIS